MREQSARPMQLSYKIMTMARWRAEIFVPTRRRFNLEFEMNDTRQWGIVACLKCNANVVRKSPKQRYCPACSPTEVALNNARRSTKKRDAAAERGASISAAVSRNITWVASGEPKIVTSVRFSMPFSYGFSKNRIHAATKDGGIVVRKQARTIMHAVAQYTKLSIGRTKFYTGKVWLDILVQKPNHKGDAVNVVDIVCDGIKLGLGIDDRWFSIRRLDWEIVRNSQPLIFIGLGQEIVEHHQACVYCGQIRPLRDFSNLKYMCFECKGSGVVPSEKSYEEGLD